MGSRTYIAFPCSAGVEGCVHSFEPAVGRVALGTPTLVSGLADLRESIRLLDVAVYALSEGDPEKRRTIREAIDREGDAEDGLARAVERRTGIALGA